MKRKIINIIASIHVAALMAVLPVLNAFAVPQIDHRVGISNSFYDPRDTYGKKLESKCQKINGPCWAFASIATLESCLAKKGLLDKSLSEKHLLNWSFRGHANQGWNIPIKNGAVMEVADGYLTSGQGPVWSSEVPYNTSNTIYSSADKNIIPKYSVRGIKLVDTDVTSIKKAISEYGAVAAVYKVSSMGYFHAVSIVGWDDDSKNWLIKNSSRAENNYQWRPYKEKLLSCRTFTDVERYNKNEKLYQHDQFGATTCMKAENDLVCANVYNFGVGEKLRSVVLYSESVGSKCTFYYAPVLEDGAPDPNRDSWVRLKDATIPYEGYSNFKIDKNFQVPTGKGAIIVQFSGKDLSIGFMSKNLKDRGRTTQSLGCSYSYLGNRFVDVLKDYQIGSNYPSMNALSIKAVTAK